LNMLSKRRGNSPDNALMNNGRGWLNHSVNQSGRRRKAGSKSTTIEINHPTACRGTLWCDQYPPISQVLSAHGIELSNPIKAIAVAVSQWIRVRDFYTTIDILSAALFLFIMAIILFRKRYPLYLQIYYLSNLLLFLSKIHHQASSLQSISRYVLTLFPAFWVIGEWLSRQAPLFRFTFLVASFGFLLIFSALYAMWVFIG